MKHRVKNQAEDRNQQIKLNSANHADAINALSHVKLAMDAGIKGLRTMSQKEWDKAYQPLMEKCSKVLAAYGGHHEV